MVSVVYEAPNSIDEAVRLLKESEIPARVLAGGTDLIIQNNSTEDQSRLIVDVKKIDGMLDAKFSKDGLELGPSMCCAELTARGDIKQIFPGLVEAAYLIGSTQVQGRASIGGNLCNASPAADTIPSLIANKAVCIISGPDGERNIAVEDFVTGVDKEKIYYTSDLFILLSHSENFGLSIAEALSYKVPVITSTNTPWKKLNNKNCGWCIKLDSKIIEKTIEKAFLLTRKQRMAMGHKGREWMIRDFSDTRIGLRMNAIYKKILKKESLKNRKL